MSAIGGLSASTSEKLNCYQFWKPIPKFECALQRLVTGDCTNAWRELLLFHWQCFGIAAAQGCDIYQNLHAPFLRPICDWSNWHRKSFESVDTPYCIVFYCMVNHMHTGRCPVALRTFNYATHIVQLAIHQKHIVALAQYLISISLDHLLWYRTMENTHLWTVAIRSYSLESTPNSGTIVFSCIREATDGVMYVEENLKKLATSNSSCPCTCSTYHMWI